MIGIPYPRIGVAVILRRKDDLNNLNYILMHIRKGSHGAGTWSFPGGHLEMGEAPEQTASRELLEEAGLDIPPSAFRFVAMTNDVFSPTKHYITLFYEAQWRIDEPEVMEPDKCERWEWVLRPPTPMFLPIINLLQQNPEVLSVDIL